LLMAAGRATFGAVGWEEPPMVTLCVVVVDAAADDEIAEKNTDVSVRRRRGPVRWWNAGG